MAQASFFPQAQHAGGPRVSLAQALVVMTFHGVVKNWNPAKGWGMILCPEAEEIYGKDTFFMKSAVITGTITPGAQVTFSVGQGSKGPQGEQIHVDGAHGLEASPVPAPVGNQYHGVVKNWNPTKEWGMIQCQETQDIYGKDMFFMK